MLTKWASEIFTKNLKVAQYIIVKLVDHFIYQVKDGQKMVLLILMMGRVHVVGLTLICFIMNMLVLL